MLKNACTYSICAICGTMRPAFANCNSWRLKNSEEIALKKIQSWQRVRQPFGCRSIGNDDESGVILVCKPCLDLVAAVDEQEAKFNQALDALWDRMRFSETANPVPQNPAPVGYKVIFDGGKKEVRPPQPAMPQAAPIRVMNPNFNGIRVVQMGPRFVMRKTEEPIPENIAMFRHENYVKVANQLPPASVVTAPWINTAATLNAPTVLSTPVGIRPSSRTVSSSESDLSYDEAPLTIVENGESEREQREKDAMLLLRLQHSASVKMESAEHYGYMGHYMGEAMLEENSSDGIPKDGTSNSYNSDESSEESGDSGMASGDAHLNGDSSSSASDPRSKKRDQNKRAAMRYRLKKKQEMQHYLGLMRGLEGRNRDLRKQLKHIVGLIEGAKMLYKSAGDLPEPPSLDEDPLAIQEPGIESKLVKPKVEDVDMDHEHPALADHPSLSIVRASRPIAESRVRVSSSAD